MNRNNQKRQALKWQHKTWNNSFNVDGTIKLLRVWRHQTCTVLSDIPVSSAVASFATSNGGTVSPWRPCWPFSVLSLKLRQCVKAWQRFYMLNKYITRFKQIANRQTTLWYKHMCSYTKALPIIKNRLSKRWCQTCIYLITIYHRHAEWHQTYIKIKYCLKHMHSMF